MNIRQLLVFLFLLNLKVASAQQISVTIDIESAQSIIKLLDQKTISDEQLSETANLYGNKLLIAKVKGYSGFGEDVFKSTLKELVQSDTIKGVDPYNWMVVKKSSNKIQKILNIISSDQKAFTSEVAAIIQSYTPSSLQLNARACLLVGGGALGFTIGNDDTFNVALQSLGSDIEGLKTLMAHELYHNVQGAGQKLRNIIKQDKPTYNEKATYILLQELWAEGTANYVGDFIKVVSKEAFSAQQKDNYIKNRNRNQTSFYLLETVLYKSYRDSTMNYSQLYNIGFTTEFDEVFYGVGYEMAKRLVEYRGKEVLSELITSDPLLFTQKYIDLYNEKKDVRFIRFSKTTEQIVAELMRWKDRMH